MTLPLPNPAWNTLERALWYTDRLVEAGVPTDAFQGANVRELADLYRAHYEPLERERDARLIRLLRETAL